jgi:SM-20-related protein
MEQWEQVPDQLAEQGWAVCENWLESPVVYALAEEARQGWEAGSFRQASIGRRHQEQQQVRIRGDQIDWWHPEQVTVAQQTYLRHLEELRGLLNHHLYLSLVTQEAHYALYPPQTCYQRHLDQFQHAPERAVSTVFYLNSDWHADEGGQLRLHLAKGIQNLLPSWNRLVLFRSADIEHEVLPATRERLSIAGWLRRRSALPITVVHGIP